MGVDKWNLPLGEQSMLDWIVNSLADCVDRIVLVTGSDSEPLPKLPKTEIVVDEKPHCGPLEGMRVGLQRLAIDLDLAFVTGCDAPGLRPEIINFLVSHLGEKQAAIPIVRQRIHPLMAVYRTKIYKLLGQWIDERALRVGELASKLDSCLIPGDALRQVDPELACLKNINRPSDYFQLLESMGLDCDPAFRRQLQRYESTSR